MTVQEFWEKKHQFGFDKSKCSYPYESVLQFAEEYHAEKLKEMLPSEKEINYKANDYADDLNSCWANDFEGFMKGADFVKKFIINKITNP